MCYMSTSLQEIEISAMKLSLEERAALAKALILSLDAPADETSSDVENLQLWVEEGERRLAELRAGTAQEVPAEEVLRRARAALP